MSSRDTGLSPDGGGGRGKRPAPQASSILAEASTTSLHLAVGEDAAVLDQDGLALATSNLTVGSDGSSTKARRQLVTRLAVCGAVMLVVAVGVALAIMTVNHARRQLEVPKTVSLSFTAEWPNAPNGPSQYEGRLHKTVAADGSTWEVTGRVWYTVPAWNRTSTLELWDGRVYVSDVRSPDGTPAPAPPSGSSVLLRAGCLTDGGPFPDVGTLESSYVGATQPDAASMRLFNLASVPQCHTAPSASADPWVASLGGETFAFCDIAAAATAGGVAEVSGEGFTARVFDVRTGDAAGAPVVTGPPSGTDGKPLDCPRMPALDSAMRNGPVTATGRRLAAGRQQPARRRLGAKPCFFMHGAGYNQDLDTTSTFTDFWGNVHTSAKCSSATFLHRDTVTKTWEDPGMQDYMCDVVAGGHTDTRIKDKYVFTSGFGTLLFAAALKNSKCKMDRGAKWYAVASMGQGSAGAAYLDGLCSNYNTYIDELNAAYHLCSGSGSVRTLNPGFKCMMPSYNPLGSVSWQDIRDQLSADVDGAMCGTSPWGLDSDISYSLDAMASESGMSSVDNDGFVSSTSCYSGSSGAAGSTGFTTSYTDNFYKPSVNHMDVNCRYGDGVYNYRKPCKWFDSL